MKQFNIYSNPGGIYEAVKKGWSWPAFFFGGFWALFMKMWALGLGFFGIFSVLGFISVAVGGELGQWLDLLTRVGGLILGIAFGNSGNYWREKHLKSRAFKFVSTVTAANGEEAITHHIEQC